MKTYEKQPPATTITDDVRHRRVRYYHSDIDPYPLHAEIELSYSDGESKMVDVEMTNAVTAQANINALLKANEDAWRAAVAKDKAVEKA